MRSRARGLPRPGPRVRALALGAGALLGLGLGAALGPDALARVEDPRLRLRHIAVAGQARLAPAEVARAAGLEPGAPLTRQALARARERLRAHPWVAEARVAAIPPTRALLAVEERRPVAQAALAEGPVLVDAGGVPFAPADPARDAELPRLVGVAEASRGRPHPVLAQGVDLVEALAAHALPPAAEVVLGGAPAEALPALVLAGSSTRVVLGSGALDAKLERLARLRGAGLAEVREAREIDLRFGDDVVLRGGPAPGGSGETGRRGGADPS